MLPFIVGKTGYLRKYTQNLFEKHNCQPNIVLETSNPGLVHFLVAANVGCAFVGYISACVSPMYIDILFIANWKHLIFSRFVLDTISGVISHDP